MRIYHFWNIGEYDWHSSSSSFFSSVCLCYESIFCIAHSANILHPKSFIVYKIIIKVCALFQTLGGINITSLQWYSGLPLDPAVLKRFWCSGEEPDWTVNDGGPSITTLTLASRHGEGFCLARQNNVSTLQYICQKVCELLITSSKGLFTMSTKKIIWFFSKAFCHAVKLKLASLSNPLDYLNPWHSGPAELFLHE